MKVVLVGPADEGRVRYAIVVPSFERAFLSRVFDKVEVDDEDTVVGIEVSGVVVAGVALSRDPSVENAFVADTDGNLYVLPHNWEGGYSVKFKMPGRAFKLWLADWEEDNP